MTVPFAALSELILAVHEVAARPAIFPEQRWRYGNIVGIGQARVRDLGIRTACDKHDVRAPIAALTVVTHRRIAVDVVFKRDGAQACALFLCATLRTTNLTPHENSWAEFLAANTSGALAAANVAARLHYRSIVE
ncbi:hypothetical protein GFY24_30290 [Nocardia sp. SYP-A9097]|uniref:hypothetical protein n=1 Tax=Nocardia sp. SYP-A9097 TaxID=2663237 RepID=UPI00129B826C|nr:hypothetical protein [Nocardia sp. SYP-A9097]MRH91680.1 hypothetical protein [Nocardia sp. SYP-A9097]